MVARSARAGAARDRDARRRSRVCAGRRHGRHGLHLVASRDDPAQQRADQPQHARSGARQNGVTRYLYTSSCLRLSRSSSRPTPPSRALKEDDAYPAQPQDALRLGEADHRAAVHALPRGLRHRDAHRPLPQHLRPARHVGRRPREGAGGDVPQGRDREADRRSPRSRSGATASRRGRSATSTTASRASRG